MNNQLRIELPMPESVNRMYENRKGGGKRLSDKASAFKAEAVLVARNAARLAGWEAPEYIEIAYWFYVPNAASDVDNLIKLTQDCIADALDFNDRRVIDLRAHKRTDRANPRCVVVVSEATWPIEEF